MIRVYAVAETEGLLGGSQCMLPAALRSQQLTPSPKPSEVPQLAEE